MVTPGCGRTLTDLAHELMKESYDETVAVIKQGGSPRDVMITSYGVDESRLPPNATEDDVAFEAIFFQNLRLHARRLSLPFEDIASVAYQDKMPSWIVWREIKRLTPGLKNAVWRVMLMTRTLPHWGRTWIIYRWTNAPTTWLVNAARNIRCLKASLAGCSQLRITSSWRRS